MKLEIKKQYQRVLNGLLFTGILLIGLLLLFSHTKQRTFPNRTALERLFFTTSDEKVSKIFESSTVYLTMSIPKSGTTALSWIAHSLFENTKEEIETVLNDHTSKIYSPDRQDTFIWKDMKISFVTVKKHRGRLHECFEGNIQRALDFPYEHHLNLFLEKNISATSNRLIKSLNNSNTLKMSDNDDSCRTKVRHLAILRNPIATAVSYQKYINPKSTKEQISEVLIKKACNKRSALLSTTWTLIKYVLPYYGFTVETLFYSDLRLNPEEFVEKFASSLGLKVTDKVIERVVSDTSPEKMKQVQESLTLSKNSTERKVIRKRFQGLSSKGENSRKVRTASLTGYEREITEEALKFCQERVRFHLPRELLEKFDLS